MALVAYGRLRVPALGFESGEGCFERTNASPEMMGELRAFFKRASWLRDGFKLSFGVLFSQVLMFLAIPVISRLYTPQIFGEYSLVLSWAVMLGSLSVVKMDSLILTRAKLLQMVRLSRVLLLLAFVVPLGMGVLSLGATFLFPEGFFESPAFVFFSLLLAVTYSFFAVFRGVAVWCHKLLGHSQALVLRSLFFVTTVCVFPFILQAMGEQTNAFPLIGAAFFADLVAIFWLGRFLPKRVLRFIWQGPIKRSFLSLWPEKRFFIVTGLGQFLNISLTQVSLLGVSFLFSPHEVGLFALALRFTTMPAVLIGSAFAPLLTKKFMACREENNLLFRLLVRVIVASFALAVFLYGGMSVLCLLFSDSFFSPGWREVGQIIALLSFSGALYLVSNLVFSLHIIAKQDWFVFLWNGSRLVCVALIVAVSWTLSLGFFPVVVFLTVCESVHFLVSVGYSYIYVSEGCVRK